MLFRSSAMTLSVVNSTPPPTWRLEFPSQQNENNKNKNRNQVQEFLNFPTSTTLSTRTLCAKLWQIQPHQLAPLPKMNKPSTLRRHRRDTLLKLPNLKQLSEPPHTHQVMSNLYSSYLSLFASLSSDGLLI